MKIVEIKEYTDELKTALDALIPQLSDSARSPSEKELIEIIKSPSTFLFIAVETGSDSTITGSLTLAVFRSPSGIKARIEDVIVDSNMRNKGIGELLTMHAIEVAKKFGANAVDLTSRPNREAANRLYKRIGFEKNQTNVYRYKIT